MGGKHVHNKAKTAWTAVQKWSLVPEGSDEKGHQRFTLLAVSIMSSLVLTIREFSS